MTENEKARELIATSETTVKVDPQNGWYLKRFAALQFEGSVDDSLYDDALDAFDEYDIEYEEV